MRKVNGEYIFNKSELGCLDSTLGVIIGSALKQFLEYHKTHPYAGCPNSYLHGESSDNDEAVEQGIEEFHSDIEKMRYAFEATEPEYEGDYTYGPEHGKEYQLGRMWDLRVDRIAWSNYAESLQEYNNKREEGLKLFALHFQELWI